MSLDDDLFKDTASDDDENTAVGAFPGMFHGYMPTGGGQFFARPPVPPGTLFKKPSMTMAPVIPLSYIYSSKPFDWSRGLWKPRFYAVPPWYWFSVPTLNIYSVLNNAHTVGALRYNRSQNYYGNTFPYVYAQMPYCPQNEIFKDMQSPPHPESQPQAWAQWWTAFLNRAAELGMVTSVAQNPKIVNWINPAYGYHDFFWIPPPYRQTIEMAWVHNQNRNTPVY